VENQRVWLGPDKKGVEYGGGTWVQEERKKRERNTNNIKKTQEWGDTVRLGGRKRKRPNHRAVSVEVRDQDKAAGWAGGM